MSRAEIERGITELGPWFYPFELAEGLRTTPGIPDQVVGIFDTRLRMLNSVLDSHFGSQLAGLDCLDIGCHEGFYSLAMAKRGLRVTGIDAREENLNRARFIARAAGINGIDYRPGRVETLSQD